MHPNDLITRAELAKSVDFSKSKVRRMEKSGELKPIITERGVRLYRYGDVADLIGDREVVRLTHARVHVPSAEKTSGELSAAVFELLEDGVQPIDIVCRLKLDHDVVDVIATKWLRWCRGMSLTGRQVKELCQALGVKFTEDPEVLIIRAHDTIRSWKRHMKCVTCKDGSASRCENCTDGRRAPPS